MSSLNRSVPRSAPTITVSHRIPSLRGRCLIPEVTTVIIEYNGLSGSGGFSSPMLFAADGKVVNVSLPLDAQQTLRELCTALLAERFPSWVDGEGSLGRFYWHLPSDRLRQAHNVRVTEAEWEAAKGSAQYEYDGDTSDLHVPF
jgi:hypothetical protein